jgi:hypothetical protein
MVGETTGVGVSDGLTVGVGVSVGVITATLGVGVGVGVEVLGEVTALKPKNKRMIMIIAKIRKAGFLFPCLLCGVKVGIASNGVSSI